VRTMKINGRIIGHGCPPYLIAEMSGNHNGTLKSAFELIDKAKAAGADAIKIQTYRPDTITLKSDLSDFQIVDGPWAGRTLYELYEWAHTPWEWTKDLFDYAKKREITLFSSPFDNTAIDLLEEFDVPAYKIASFEAIDLPLISRAANTGKPLIISTGMASQEEIAEAVSTARKAGCKELALLLCVSSYPAPTDEYNLLTLLDMAKRFDVVVGLSDHSLENHAAIAAVSLGASIVEKHLTLNRDGGGPDDGFSLEPQEFKQLTSSCQSVWKSLGTVTYQRKASEMGNVKFRRSLYFVKNLKKGECISSEAVKSIRPGYGLPPKFLNEVIGKTLLMDVSAGTPVDWDKISSRETQS